LSAEIGWLKFLREWNVCFSHKRLPKNMGWIEISCTNGVARESERVGEECLDEWRVFPSLPIVL